MKRCRPLAPGLALLAAQLLGACGTPTEPPQAAASTLPQGVVAKVDAELVSDASVARAAERQGLPPKEALSRVLSDAVFAAAARKQVPQGVTPAIERAAAARALLERIGADAAAAGPPTVAEIGELLEERWPELDRPDAARTTHVVVINQDAAREARAKALAEMLLAAVSGATSSDDFIRRAKDVPKAGFDVRPEALPLLTADGRSFERQNEAFVATPVSFDLDFARAANALRQPGELSPVVKTRFGFHVIRLEERLPGSSVPKAELLTLLTPEMLTRRASRLRNELLQRLRGPSAIQIERAVDELTARVQVGP